MTVQAINLIPQDTPRQIDMFMDAAKQDKLERMEKCVEEIRRRFGKGQHKEWGSVSEPAATTGKSRNHYADRYGRLRRAYCD